MSDIRPFFDSFTDAQIAGAIGGYHEDLEMYVLIVGGTSALRYHTITGRFGIDEFPIEIISLQTIVDDNGVAQLIAGGVDGYMYRVYDNAAGNFGNLGNQFAYVATAGAASTVTVDNTANDLGTVGDGLTGLWVTKITAAWVVETKKIVSNTTSVITISGTWTTNPVVGDRVFVGGIKAFAEFAEQHYCDAASPTQTKIDSDYGDPANLLFRVRSALGGTRNVDTTSFSISQIIGKSDLDAVGSQIGLPPGTSSKALRPRIEWYEEATALVHRELEITVNMSDADAQRKGFA